MIMDFQDVQGRYARPLFLLVTLKHRFLSGVPALAAGHGQAVTASLGSGCPTQLSLQPVGSGTWSQGTEGQLPSSSSSFQQVPDTYL